MPALRSAAPLRSRLDVCQQRQQLRWVREDATQRAVEQVPAQQRTRQAAPFRRIHNARYGSHGVVQRYRGERERMSAAKREEFDVNS
jgi:hypothetical protein